MTPGRDRESATCSTHLAAKFVLAAMIGSMGGALFALFRVPLAWMLGSMVACTIASMAGAPLAAPKWLRNPLVVTIGILLGSSFSKEFLADLIQWWPTILGMLGFLLVGGLICVLYMRLVAGYDPVTAFFAGMPGGLNDMVILSEAYEGDARIVALTHSTRVLIVVSALPLIMAVVGHVELVPIGRTMSPLQFSLSGVLWCIATALVGILIGHLLRLPAKYLLGPMVASAVVHAAGWTSFLLPTQLTSAAQVGLGLIIGCRFAGISPLAVLPVLAHSVVISILLIAETFLFSFAVGALTGVPAMQLVLAYSPAGLTEMSLVALSLHYEVVFVATHHILRIFVVILAAQYLAANTLARGRRR